MAMDFAIDFKKFATENLFKATSNLFAQLGIELNSNTEQNLFPKEVLNEKFKDRSPFKNIKELYFVGLIDDSIFNSAETIQYETAIEIADKKYEGLMLFAMELDKTPNRGEIAELTRVFNQISQKMPVGLVLKYENKISLALSERFKYLQNWRPGEKVGKVIILRDINIEKTHAGHLRILEDLAKHKAKNFNELHAAWLKVLNIKTLNDSFYERLVGKMDKKGNITIKGWYFKCLEDIQINLNAASKILDKRIDDELKPQAVIRVIIRLMFIWFMEKKGLIKDVFFKRDFVNDFLKDRNTYYNAILQNLFFAVLNKKIDERRFRKQDKSNPYDPQKNDYGIFDVFRYNSFFKGGKADEFVELTKTIPFVNGGLFQCHDYKFAGNDIIKNSRNKEQNYIIDGFSDNPKDIAKISDEVIFDLIDLFNDFVFTIEESTPYEQDIALDPELLGTIFENLIAFYNPETRENARKQTGSFYTPREIVDYMCNESLKESLKTKFPGLHSQIDSLIDNNEDYLNFPEKNKMLAAITDLKILDPACGSGAFPMGMFNLMVRTVEKLQEHKTTYKNKLDIIMNCIYGVDIQNIAIEISKLRFFISLLVDCPKPQNIKDFDVLPNLETKFVVANTLIGIEKKKGQHELFDLNKEFQELTKIFLPFTTAKTPKEKEKIKNDFNEKKEEIVNNPNFEFDKNTKEKINAWDPFNVCYCAPFFDSKIMFGLSSKDTDENGCFDVVIGNPPYVSNKALQNKNEYEKTYKTARGQYDLFSLFIEKAFELCTLKGIQSFIIPDSYVGRSTFTLSREYFFNNSSCKKLLQINNVFENANVSSLIYVTQCKSKYFDGEVSFIKTKSVKDWINGSFSNYILSQKSILNTPNYKILHLDNQKYILIQKLLNCKNVVGKYCFLWRGEEIGENSNFILDFENQETYPILSGTNVQRYFIKKDMKFIEKKNIYKDLNDYQKEKIVIRQLGEKINAAYDSEALITNQSVYCISSNSISIKILLAILNSKLIAFIYDNYFKEKQEFPRILLENLKEIPVPDITSEEQQPIISLVDKIISAKEKNPKADTSELEREIDKLVYGLYGLNDGEVEVVEGE